jgi:excisionase family DNA binding protein
MSTPILDVETDYRPFHTLSAEELLNEDETAHYLRISPRLMVDLIQQNRIPYYRFGWRTVRIKVADLREFLENTRIPSKAVRVQSRISKKETEPVPA